MSKEISDKAVKWARNIRDNFKGGAEESIYSQLVDASKELGIPMSEIERRYQYSQESDWDDYRMIYYIITGDGSRFGTYY